MIVYDILFIISNFVSFKTPFDVSSIKQQNLGFHYQRFFLEYFHWDMSCMEDVLDTKIIISFVAYHACCFL